MRRNGGIFGTYNALTFGTWHILAPSFGVPSMPLMKKVN